MTKAGAFIRTRRKHDKATLVQYAQRLGCPAAYLSDVECGRRQVRLARAAHWDQTLRCDHALLRSALQDLVDATGAKLAVVLRALR